ncbi:exonuclease SbcC [Sediminihabitans luteus]|uniref:Nuclease SbcCD subunit C n=1 Tax=Sediminihabitans luteus TaxID=1138585 RepID=A0A2M9CD16_9CELL|nr:SMC family ATPase [Sediminihabitans luteus]PJJ69287.1 exonuclease SbcC [Sediminihabitans luteus]GII98969.1 nuclease SbcCD subunit C [Sediminihabitans luteus]
MHLHSMTFQAIGPFPGRHTIDFAELAASGIFLLDGPTGAGKSTVIDAVVFALYGKVASEAASEDRLRSAYATPEVESFVDLVFETGAGVFRVRRSPEYQRPKKRGDGTTTQQATVRLWRLASVPDSLPGSVPDGDVQTGGLPTGDLLTDDAADALDALDAVGELLSSRLDEAGAEIQRYVGLDRRQFAQTVVLPQGEFASFLRAEPEKRRDLLQKVFGTEIYEDVQKQLAEMQREAGRVVAAARQAVHGGVENFLGAAGLDPTDVEALRAAEAADPHDAVELAATKVEALAGEADALAADEVAASGVLVAAQDHAETARVLTERLARRDALRTEQGALDERADEVATTRERLAAAQRAEVVAPVLAGLRRARDEHAATLENQELARAGVPAALAEADVPELLSRRDAVGEAATRLAMLLPTGERLPVDEAALVEARKEVERLAAERALLADDLATRPARRATLVASRDATTELAGTLGVRQQAVLDAESVLRAARGAAQHATDLEAAVEERTAAADRAREALGAERDLRAARIAGIAGELATGLAAGTACVVCGSTEHPAPARLTDDHVTPERVEQAEAERSAAEQALTTAGERVTTLTERLEALRSTSRGLDVDAADAALAAARDDAARATTAVAERDAAEAALTTFDDDTAALTAQHAELGTEAAARRSTAEALAASIARDRAEVARELDVAAPLLDGIELPDVLGERERPENPVEVYESALRERARAVDALLAAHAAVDAAARTLAERERDLAQVLDDAGFDDATAALAASCTAEEREALDRAVREHESAVARVRAGLTEPALADLADDAAPDLDAARAAVRAAQEAADRAGRRAALAQQRLAGARTAAASVGSAVTAWDDAREHAAPVTRMAGLAQGSSGDNARGLSLATFVLVRRFEEVVEAANVRLVEMSGGRYELVRSDEKEAVRARRTGLAMKVVDHWTERSRDPRTLSGGETFYVSLCLALGMADVVTAEAGGVDLGTLFVDEGFGTLDPQALEAVLGELGRLRAGGRVVGVVSHVEALKQSIAERIEVRRLPSGASTLSVRAGG